MRDALLGGQVRFAPNGWWTDGWFYVKNNHVFISIFLAHPSHPYTRGWAVLVGVVGCLCDAGASTGASVGEDGKRVNTAMLDSSAQALRAEEAAARSKWGSMLQQHAADAGGSASAAVALAAGAATKSSAAVRSQANRATAGGCTAEDLAEGLSTADDHYEVD